MLTAYLRRAETLDERNHVQRRVFGLQTLHLGIQALALCQHAHTHKHTLTFLYSICEIAVVVSFIFKALFFFYLILRFNDMLKNLLTLIEIRLPSLICVDVQVISFIFRCHLFTYCINNPLGLFVFFV